jgi:hypothetical protein
MVPLALASDSRCAKRTTLPRRVRERSSLCRPYRTGRSAQPHEAGEAAHRVPDSAFGVVVSVPGNGRLITRGDEVTGGSLLPAVREDRAVPVAGR